MASDALGCVRLVTDSSGEVVFRRDYGAFGETLPGGFDNVPGGMPYGFVGGLGVRTDADSGLIYMRQRWYDPTLQRFISRDPIGLSGGANLYSYANNAPARYVDATGLNRDEPPTDIRPSVNPDTMRPQQRNQWCRKLLRLIRHLRKSIFRRIRHTWKYTVRKHPDGDLTTCERARNRPEHAHQSVRTHIEDVAFDSRWLDYYYRQWVRYCLPDFDPNNVLGIPDYYMGNQSPQIWKDPNVFLILLIATPIVVPEAAPIVTPIILNEAI